MADALRSGRSVRKGVGVQISPSAPYRCACSSVGLERSPAEAQVVGSSPTKRTIGRLAQLVRAPALHAGGHRFESYTAHHIWNLIKPSVSCKMGVFVLNGSYYHC
jgi:hypothetical protein